MFFDVFIGDSKQLPVPCMSSGKGENM